MMRGGTSRGPFFLATDLPKDPAARDAVLISVMGAGHELQIDGIGGANAVTSKVAIIARSSHPDADVDYLFAQVKVRERVVDTSPNCGNMLAAVGPFAIESALVPAVDGLTRLRIFNVNTGKIIESSVLTPQRQVTYVGDTEISGVPGTAAPILLTFMDAAGSKTGTLLPTGRAVDIFDGIEVSCVDAAMPVILIRAADLGKTGYETPAALTADTAFIARLEKIRIAAGAAMHIADAADRVIPKPVLLAPGRDGATLTVRYFMPHDCHSALATTGSVALAHACCTPGTLAAELCGPLTLPRVLSFAHPCGRLDVMIERRTADAGLSVSIVRTARRLFEGSVFARIDAPVNEAAAPDASMPRPLFEFVPKGDGTAFIDGHRTNS